MNQKNVSRLAAWRGRSRIGGLVLALLMVPAFAVSPLRAQTEEASPEEAWDWEELGEELMEGLSEAMGEAMAEAGAEESPEELPGDLCVTPEPRKLGRSHRSCDGKYEGPCAVWDPPLSDLCGAQWGRLGVEIDYRYFGQVDCRSSARKEEVSMIVIHNGDHARGNDYNWKCRKSAAHYTIDRDGTVYQHIGEERAAWHAKQVNHKSIGIELQILRGYGSSCNSLTGKALTRVAEREGKSEGEIVRELCAPTFEQYLALRGLIADIRSRHTVAEEDVVGHCEVDRPGGHADPRALDWGYLDLSNEDKLAKVESSDNACTWYHLTVEDGVEWWEGVLE